MKINLDGNLIEVTVFERRKNNYEYYIGSVQIGEIDTNISKYENIIIRENSIILALQKLGVIERQEKERKNTLENELSAKIKDQIDSKRIEDIKKESEETKKLKEYIKEIGLQREKIKDIKILELNKKEEKKKTSPKQTKLEEKKEETTTKDINVKQEMELDERANDMHSIRKWLENRVPHNIKKIGVIESYQMSKIKDENSKSYDNETTRYSLIAISKDGKVEPLKKYIPELQQRSASGNDPIPQKYQVRDDGSVDKDSVLSEYEIGNKIIQLDNKEMGRIEMNIGEEARNSTKTIGVQLRDSNTIYVPDTSQRSVIGEYEPKGENTVEEGLKEIEPHDNCQEKDERDIDGDPDTSSHEHIMNIEDTYIKVCAREILNKNPEIGEIYNQADIERKLKEEIKEESLSKKDLENSLDEISKKIEEEAENQRLPGEDKRIG
mgnify:FL=1